MNTKGGYDEGRATWTGFWILDGRAVQDLWVSEQPDGSEFHGTNIRSFNPKTVKWDNRRLPQGSLQWKSDESEQSSYDGGKTWIEGIGFIEATRSNSR